MCVENIRVLMVEDDVEIALKLKEFLGKFQMDVTVTDDPYMALSSVDVEPFDVILLDLTLPGMDGMEVCEKIRNRHKVPIIVSSARNETQEKVACFNMGVDDYMCKPYDPRELEARIRSVLRRFNEGGPTQAEKPKSTGDFDVDAEAMEIRFKGEKLRLTNAEFGILAYLIKKQGMVVSREELIANVDAIGKETTNKSIDVIVFRLRQKVEPNPKHPQYIQSIRGIGYKLSRSDSTSGKE